MLMDDLSSKGANCPSHFPGLKGLKLLKVVDSLAEFQAFYIGNRVLKEFI